MNLAQRGAAAMLLLITGASVAAMWTCADYAVQNRDHISEPPSWRFPLGTDDLGRDNLARVLSGLRVSLGLACMAAAASSVIALLAGVISGSAGAWAEKIMLDFISLIESVPWLFLFLGIRALVPLNAPPMALLWLTFFMLAVLGWTHAGRVIQAIARDFHHSEALLFARACGIFGWRLWLRQIAPLMRRPVLTQFTILIPVFILSEAGLGVLGLGIPEPQPSLGNLLRQLQNPDMIRWHPVILAPLALLVIVVLCLHTICGNLEANA